MQIRGAVTGAFSFQILVGKMRFSKLTGIKKKTACWKNGAQLHTENDYEN